jgi:lipid-A-disaccharide synthase
VILPAARVLIVGGEASGDLYGGLLMRAMADFDRGIEFTGIGGPSMQAAGLRLLGDARQVGVTGMLEVAARLPVIWRAYRAARGAAADPQRPIDLAILIDYPDFNLRLAPYLHGRGIPVLYFVSPQVWAWRRGRVKLIARCVNRMLVILPFEQAFYREAGVDVTFVGHPLLDLVRPERNRRQTLSVLNLDPGRPTVALLPGSRGNEVRSLFAVMLAAARRLRDEFRDLQFVIPVAPTIDRPAIEAAVRAAGRWDAPPPLPVPEARYDAIAACDAAVVASGTATLECALLGVPMVITYRVNRLTFAMARRMSSLPHIGMPNLIAGREIVPELMQGECRPDRIAAALRALLTDPARAATMRDDLSKVRARLGEPGSIDRAARAAWDMIADRRAIAAAKTGSGPFTGGRGQR